MTELSPDDFCRRASSLGALAEQLIRLNRAEACGHQAVALMSSGTNPVFFDIRYGAPEEYGAIVHEMLDLHASLIEKFDLIVIEPDAEQLSQYRSHIQETLSFDIQDIVDGK